jgi:hypothetical protein
MPVSQQGFGQLITFAIEKGGDQQFEGYTHVRTTRVMNTVQKVASWRGQPDQARRIANLNGIRSVTKKLRRGTRLRVPDRLRRSASFNVLAGDEPPKITGGYAKVESVDRPLRTALSVFTGYDPITMEVPVRFEAFISDSGSRGPYGADVEADIALLEQMAGRGNFHGAGQGAPPLVQLSTTDALGRVVPLIPLNYQWSKDNPTAPIWWITNIDWGDGALRNLHGNRIRQEATVTVMQYVRPRALTART